MSLIVAQKIKGLSLRFLIVAILFLAALFVFMAIADEMVLEKENNLDIAAFQYLRRITYPGMTKAMLFITFFGSDYFLIPAYLLLITYFLWFKNTQRLSLDIAAIGITSTIILFSLKALFHRHRPLDPLVRSVNGFSFPSGHAFSSFTFFGLAIYLVWQHNFSPLVRWSVTVFFFLFASAIAFSRVYLHVHYASDVVAGFCLCIVWLGFSFWAMKKFRYRL